MGFLTILALFEFSFFPHGALGMAALANETLAIAAHVLSILEKSFQKSYKIPLLSEIP